jgi:CubicO group peptidase (beta-lactamase class C family)
MKNTKKTILTISSLFSAFLSACAPQTNVPKTIAELDLWLSKEAQNAKFPGFAVAIALENKVVFSQGYGVLNKESKQPVTPDSPFSLASVSKLVTGTAIMKAVQAGKLDLDADINIYLPFQIQNPRVSGKITLRHLATHTSGLIDNPAILEASYGAGDSPVQLGDFLKSYFTPTGSRFNAELNFANSKPSEKYIYSNVAIGLAAYILEYQTGINFADYTEKNIFTPLGMNNTHWFLRDFPSTTNLAFPYDAEYPTLTHYGYPTYPDGQLRSSVNDMAKFLIALMNEGQFQNTQLLEAKTMRSMIEPQFPNAMTDKSQGLFVEFKSGLLGHAGGDPGAACYLYWNPKNKFGAVIMANTAVTDQNNKNFVQILKTLLREPSTEAIFR